MKLLTYKAFKTFLFFILLLISSVNQAQKVDFTSITINQKDYYQELDFELVLKKIIIPVTINNKTYKFLLDTGAPNIISNTVLKELEIENQKNISVSDANNKQQEMNLVLVKSIKINDLDFRNSAAIVSDLNNHFLLKCYGIDGFIGSNLLQNSVLKISLKDKKIVITNDVKKLKPTAKPTKLKLVGAQKSPFVALTISGKNCDIGTEYALLDTGMDGLYDISNRINTLFQKENIVEKLASNIGAADIGLFGVNDSKEQHLVKINALKINQTSFENIITTTTDDDNSRIGLDLLKYGDVIIDFKNKKFYFEAEEKINLNDKQPPVSLSFNENHKIIIGHVWNNDYLDKIQFGDEVIRLDSYNFREMNTCDILMTRQLIKEKSSYEMEILREDNTTFTIKIEK
ncbi:retropepsin-like aspartic protease [Flavobacterium macrobrachii]|uniref:Clan AA aspartic protease n=1 Tax=Flavobacterium macrobrachii TaxID=591204 RepID=A0ABS2D0M4_9FLAO|nr:retropepsin-like aspartic protease [Flavobacterium macrobrachii]MBM6500764.1 clan AA aspartic protease [Flavobacterium macrobrachii]